MTPTRTPVTSTDTLTGDSAGTGPLADVAHLYKVRNGVRAVLALGVAASVAGNVLHAQPTVVGRAIAAWSPLALLLAVELISRVPAHRPILSALRMLATAVIAGIAAWVSYGHMVSVAMTYGEQSSSAHLLPVSVDGLVVAASVCLVEIADRLHAATDVRAEPVAEDAVIEPEPDAEPDADPEPEPEPDADPEPEPEPKPVKGRKPRTAKVATATAVTRLRAKHPEWTVAQIAERVGVTDRTVRRHLNTTVTATEPTTETGTAATDLAA